MAEKMMKSSMTMAQAASDTPFEKMVKNAKRRRQVLKSGGGKYSMPVRYALRKFVKGVGEGVENIGKNIKTHRDKKRAMEDASGPTSRNKSVGVCTAKGKCQ